MFTPDRPTTPLPTLFSGAGPHLTTRQWEFWTLLAQGLSNGAIAQRLGLSGKWVENATGELYAALSISTSESGQNARVRAALLYHQACGLLRGA